MKTKTFEDYINAEKNGDDKHFIQANGILSDGEEDIFEEDEGELVLVYVDKIGEDHAGIKTYNFMFSKTPDIVWGEDWHQVPASNCGKIPPDSSTYSDIKRLRSIIDFEIINDSTCFSMQDAIDQIVAVAWENISEYDDYPEDGRLVFHFGETYQSVEDKLATKHQLFAD